MKNAVKGKNFNPLILILLLLVFFLMAEPAITHGENGQPSDGVNSPSPTNGEEMFRTFDTLLLSIVQSMVI